MKINSVVAGSHQTVTRKIMLESAQSCRAEPRLASGTSGKLQIAIDVCGSYLVRMRRSKFLLTCQQIPRNSSHPTMRHSRCITCFNCRNMSTLHLVSNNGSTSISALWWNVKCWKLRALTQYHLTRKYRASWKKLFQIQPIVSHYTNKCGSNL